MERRFSGLPLQGRALCGWRDAQVRNEAVTQHDFKFHDGRSHYRHIPAPPKVAFSAGVSCVPLKFLDKLPGANRFSILRHLSISPDMFQDFPYE